MLKRIAGLVVVLGTTAVSSDVTASDPSKIMVFGDRNNKVYLGCLSCSQYETDSVWNQYGDYGSKYASSSMWNTYGDYGGKYSSYSPCNQYTNTSPVIVDGAGAYYGHLSVSSIYAGSSKALQIAQTICKE